MKKITIMLPVEIDVEIRPAGNMHVGSATWPRLCDIEDQLGVLRSGEARSHHKVLETFGDITLIQK